MEKSREDGARLLEVHKQNTRGNMRNSDAHKEKRSAHGESDEPLRDVAQRGGWIFILGDVQDSAEQALKNLP